MSTPTRKLFLIKGYREAYYQLSDEAQARFWETVTQAENSVGARGLIACNSRWADEATAYWGVVEYPDLQAVQKVTELHEQNAVFRYVDAQTLLGVPMEDTPDGDLEAPVAICQLFIMENVIESWESLAEDTRTRVFGAVLESIGRNGGRLLLACDVGWSNEEHSAFGVIGWPKAEAIQGHFKDLEKIGWHRYVRARTILGTKDT